MILNWEFSLERYSYFKGGKPNIGNYSLFVVQRLVNLLLPSGAQDISLSILKEENSTLQTSMINFPSFTSDSPVSWFENCNSEFQYGHPHFSDNFTILLIPSVFLSTTSVEGVEFSQMIDPFIEVSGVRRE